jgi:dihydroxyacetone kinase
MRASRHLAGVVSPSPEKLAEAFSLAVQAISDLGGAKPGDRTMIDALRPAADAFTHSLNVGNSLAAAWQAAVDAGVAGADATKTMHPRLGRASYLGERAVGHPDGGAVAVSIWLKSLVAAD